MSDHRNPHIYAKNLLCYFKMVTVWWL